MADPRIEVVLHENVTPDGKVDVLVNVEALLMTAMGEKWDDSAADAATAEAKEVLEHVFD